MEQYPKIFYSKTKLDNQALIDFDSYKSGITESYFDYKINKYFKGHIKTNMVIDNGWKYPYQPDFILYYPKFDLCIDIEIDEPYAMGTKEPIHFNDERRNNFFLSKGWHIIRFAEEQICKYPDLCCKVISEFIRFITGENIWIEGLDDFKDIPDISAWTKSEAEKMANISYRNNYLKFLQNIDKQNPQISIIADGIFLNSQISEARDLYTDIWPKKELFDKAKISLILKFLLGNVSRFPNLKIIKGKIYIEFRIYISTYHSMYNFTFDSDLIYIDDFIINIYYIRTENLICFEIDEYILNKNIINVLLIADDPAYPHLMSNWKNREVILVRKIIDTHMPVNLRYIDVSYPSAVGIGLERTEL
ncbi:hypothetical protein [Flavobacterium sp. ASV13]|uniref:hypothetical protein n=1 Tax=Flavobacterium sp. ASV13 TaxID=1506583 RepID=UPI00068F6CC4|nr:hypothetical protein [Flavobacterium sp. ASV13]